MEHSSMYGACRRCRRPMASRAAAREDRAFIEHGSNGYCVSCHRQILRGSVDQFDRPPVHNWIGDAACAKPGVNPDWFFPDSTGTKETVTAARFICAGCSVREACTSDMKVSGDRFGVRAGTTAFQRRRAA